MKLFGTKNAELVEISELNRDVSVSWTKMFQSKFTNRAYIICKRNLVIL